MNIPSDIADEILSGLILKDVIKVTARENLLLKMYVDDPSMLGLCLIVKMNFKANVLKYSSPKNTLILIF